VEKVTKMGVGVYSGGGGHLIDLLFRTQPTIILLMDPDPEFAKDVRRWFPKAFIVGRRYFPQQPLDNPAVRGEQVADYVAALAVPLKGVVNTWMSYNEVVTPGDYEAYKRYNTFQVAFARKLQGTYGIDAVAGNDGIGVVSPEDYAEYFAQAIQESRYFGIHAYPPRTAGSMKEDTDWYVLRYRLIYQALERAGVKHGPFIITESGLWAGFPGYTTEQRFADDLIWFTDELEKDAYVLGHAIYGIFATDQADNTDISRYPALMDRIGAYTPKR
jgi:hypothetical protein